MKKLRRNWSLKKSDISKSWSRIRKYSSPSMMPPIRPAFPITITQTNTLRRKPSRRSTSTTGSSGIGQVTIPDTKSVVRHHGGPVVGDGSNNDTTFYITLTIEQDDDDDDPLERIDSEYLLFTDFPPQGGFSAYCTVGLVRTVDAHALLCHGGTSAQRGLAVRSLSNPSRKRLQIT